MVNKVFYRLLRHKQLPLSDPEIQEIMANEALRNRFESLAEAFDCHLGLFEKNIYLIPSITNNWLGYSKKELKARLLKSNQPVAYYYLYMFIILTLLNEFYGTSYGKGKTRTYIHLGELMNHTAENLRLGVEQGDKNSEVPYERMLAVYESLKSEMGRSEANSKKKLFETILKFLEEQELIIRIEGDDSIRATERLDALADYVLRSSQGYSLMQDILKGESEDAQT